LEHDLGVVKESELGIVREGATDFREPKRMQEVIVVK